MKKGDRVFLTDCSTDQGWPAAYAVYVGAEFELTADPWQDIRGIEHADCSHVATGTPIIARTSWLVPATTFFTRLQTPPPLSVAPQQIFSYVAPIWKVWDQVLSYAPPTEAPKAAADDREFDGFCDPCGGFRKHRMGCPCKRSMV